MNKLEKYVIIIKNLCGETMVKQIGEITLYTIKELSEIMEISVPTLRNYVKQGKIISRKIGNSYFITEESLKNFLQPNSVTKITPGKRGDNQGKKIERKIG